MSIFRGGDDIHHALLSFNTKNPYLAGYQLDAAGNPQKDVYLKHHNGTLWCVPPPAVNERKRERGIGISVFRTLHHAQAVLESEYIYEFSEESLAHTNLELRWDDLASRKVKVIGHGVVRIARDITAYDLLVFLRGIQPIQRFRARLYAPPPIPLILA